MSNMEFNDFYSPTHEVTPLTMAVLAQFDMDGNSRTCVLEEQTDYTVLVSSSKIIDNACKYFGASLRGRQDGTRDICGLTHKAPIAVDPSSGMYFFPTTSPANPKCSWIAHSHIDQVSKVDQNETEILFKNGRRITIPVSYGSMLNQIQRTAQFRYLLDNRIKYLLKQNGEMVAEPFA
ncbi:competence protein ComK [Virgibacillus siamensis]|uniref:competence protein ComK n=1 Tax=Virgibacillus siamensis TaxID=480071 RepID=UPI001FE3F902|nr:competence protein ComK [Virgibacillus siamensis]